MVALPLTAVILVSIHYYKVARSHGISLPAYIEEGDVAPEVRKQATQRIDFIPDILTHELFLISLGIFVLLAAAALFYHAPLESQANPQHTPLDTQAPWFFIWVQGLLKLGNTTVMGVIVPVLLVALLFAVPYIDLNPRRMARKRPLALALGGSVVMALLVLTYMGTSGYGIGLPPAVRIVQTIAPEEGIGPLRSVPYEQLKPGVYTTGSTPAVALSPGLTRVLNLYASAIRRAAATQQLPQAQGSLIVADRQPDLKTVTLRIKWRDLKDGKIASYERIVYLHRYHFGAPGGG